MDDSAWGPTLLAKNRRRLPRHDLAAAFFNPATDPPPTAKLLPEEHFTVARTFVASRADRRRLRPEHTEPPTPPDRPAHGPTRSPRSPMVLADRLLGGACPP